jgi:methyl-accepting chemotaxis protein
VLRYSARSARARAALLTCAYLLVCVVVAGFHAISLRIAGAADAADDAQSEATEARRMIEDTQQDVATLNDDMDGLQGDVDDLHQTVAALRGRVQQ